MPTKKRRITKRNSQQGKRPTTTTEKPATTRTANRMERCGKIPTRAQELNNILKQTYNLPRQADADVQSIQRGKHVKITIKECTDWNDGKTFTGEPIQINRDTRRITQMRNYIHTERRRKAAIRTKQCLSGTITYTLGK